MNPRPKPTLAGNRRALIRRLKQIAWDYGHDYEVAHGTADDAIMEYLDDPLIRKYYDAVPKWYA